MTEASDHIEAVVIGAGVIGLAIARALALSGREVVVLEANLAIGEETSARNNEVIHAGFLYPEDSLKARLCKRGRDMLYAFAAERGIGHRKLPKLLPAIDENDVPLLETYLALGQHAGVNDLTILSAGEVAKLEPGLKCHAALLSPSTGIVDSHALMIALQGDAEEHGAAIAFGTRITGGDMGDGRIVLTSDSGGEVTNLSCDILINAAGLGAERIARAMRGFPGTHVPKVYFAKGEFYAYNGKTPFSHLIVPPPLLMAQGASLTIDMGGQVKFGPDLSFVNQRDYSVAPDSADTIAAAVREFWPDIDISRLSPGYAGIRPRVTGPGEPPGDWSIKGPADHGVPGMVHLFGMDTPGLTSCIAIADHVLEALDS